jgi:hypothetical protein
MLPSIGGMGHFGLRFYTLLRLFHSLRHGYLTTSLGIRCLKSGLGGFLYGYLYHDGNDLHRGPRMEATVKVRLAHRVLFGAGKCV